MKPLLCSYARTLFFLVLVSGLTLPLVAQETSIPANSILDCDADTDGTLDGDPADDQSPDIIDIVGDHTGGNSFWSAATFHDASNTGYLYFALRLNEDPRKNNGTFAEQAWVALLQVPSGSDFQYQWLLNLSGNQEEVQIWENTTASDIDFVPLFNDPAEGVANNPSCNQGGNDPNWCGDWTAGAGLGPTAPNDPYNMNGALARVETASSSIDGSQDYLLFWAAPIAQMITLGIISDHSDLNATLFYLATSSNDNNYNKDHLNCPFGPSQSVLDITKNAAPTTIQQGTTNTVTFSINVTNTSSTVAAEGVVIEDHDFGSCFDFDATDVTVTCLAGNGCTNAVVQTAATPDLVVQVDKLEAAGSVSISVATDVTTCGVGHVNNADAFATNAALVTDAASVAFLLPVELTTFEAQLNGREALLTWQTASETNNAGFEIQHLDRTTATQTWHAMDFVEGHGTTALPQSYRYAVDNLAPGRHRFRLKQIDFDGAFEYSPEVEVIVEMVERFVLEPVYPNPFNPEAQFRFAVRQGQAVQVDLFDMLGRRVRTLYRGQAEAGQMQVVRIDGSSLPSGLYVVRVVGHTFVDTQQVTLLR